MVILFVWAFIFSVSTAAAITLIGDRNLISGNLLKWQAFVHLIFHWKFILSIVFAVFARFSFIMMNNSILKIPALAENSTTITSFVSASAFIFVVISNYIFLSERLTFSQGAGAMLIMLGIWFMFK